MNKKQTLSIASLSMFAAGMAHGDILYSGLLNHDVAAGGSDFLDLQNIGTIDYTVAFDNKNQQKPYVNAQGSASQNPNAYILSKTNTGCPITPFGTNINAAYAAIYSTNKVGYLFQKGDQSVAGDWSSTVDTDAYVGLELNDGAGTINYGWVHLIYKGTSAPKSVVLVDYAYETTAGKGIIAGATVNVDVPHIYKEPQSRTNGGGTTATFNVVALADPAPTYQWQAGSGGVYTNLPENAHFSGTTTATLAVNSVGLSDAIDYIVIVSNSLATATSSPAAHLTVIPGILAGPFPTQEQLFVGLNGHFGIQVVSGVPTGYQWRKGGVNLTDTIKYPGCTTSSNMVITGLVTGDAGNFDVVMATAFGNITSSVAPLSLALTNEIAVASALVDHPAPVVYYRLNETNSPSTGPIAFDNVSAVNGAYQTNGLNNVPGPGPADGFPGFSSTNLAFSVLPNVANSTIQLPGCNLNTNTVTITAWINPAVVASNQLGGCGIVYTRSTNLMVCGLAYYGGFGNPDLSLGFNWHDDHWNYNSGIKPPTNTWSFISLVVTPTNATIWMFNTNGIQSAVVVGAYPVQAFNDVIYIGQDSQGAATGGNNFNGKIDEVAIYNQSLTYDQLFTQFLRAQGKIAQAPTITLQPKSQSLYQGQTAHFAVQAIGSIPLFYQWESGTGGVYAPLTNATNSILTVPNISPASAIDYIVTVSNAGGVTNSTAAHVTLVPTPSDAYTAAILAAGGTNGVLGAFYPLNETNDPASGSAVAFDYAGGHNGIYGIWAQNGNPTNLAIAGPGLSDGFSGFNGTNYAVRVTGSNLQSAVVCAPLNLVSATGVTMTAWINPASKPQPWAGLVFCRASGSPASGLNFSPTNANGDACLGYHWNDDGNTYNWSSGLVVPTNQWSFVALVVDPVAVSATVWLINSNGVQSAINNAAANAIMPSFSGSLYIGADPLAAADVFDGSIDEVGVFSKALSASQIQSLYSASVGELKLILNGLQLQWSSGTLLEAPSLAGPWTTNNAPSPFTIVPTAPQKFYRLIQ